MQQDTAGTQKAARSLVGRVHKGLLEEATCEMLLLCPKSAICKTYSHTAWLESFYQSSRYHWMQQAWRTWVKIKNITGLFSNLLVVWQVLWSIQLLCELIPAHKEPQNILDFSIISLGGMYLQWHSGPPTGKTWIPETCLSTTSLCGAPVCPGMCRGLYSLVPSNDSLPR